MHDISRSISISLVNLAFFSDACFPAERHTKRGEGDSRLPFPPKGDKQKNEKIEAGWTFAASCCAAGSNARAGKGYSAGGKASAAVRDHFVLQKLLVFRLRAQGVARHSEAFAVPLWNDHCASSALRLGVERD